MASVGIFYRESNPSQILIEMKDDGYPVPLWRRMLCPPGGNWIGESATMDISPHGTFLREIGEEFTLERPIRNSIELEMLGVADAELIEPAPISDVPVTDADTKALAVFKSYIGIAASPFGDYLNTMLVKGELQTALISYWTIPIDETMWAAIVRLQEKFGNISNESVTMITSLDEIVRTGTKTAFGHDRVLKRFFLKMGLKEAETFPLVEGQGIVSEFAGPTLGRYSDYLEIYEIAKKPI